MSQPSLPNNIAAVSSTGGEDASALFVASAASAKTWVVPSADVAAKYILERPSSRISSAVWKSSPFSRG